MKMANRRKKGNKVKNSIFHRKIAEIAGDVTKEQITDTVHKLIEDNEEAIGEAIDAGRAMFSEAISNIGGNTTNNEAEEDNTSEQRNAMEDSTDTPEKTL